MSLKPMQLKISFKEIKQILEISSPDLPTYVSPLLNLANQFAQGTRPKVVGKMSQLIQDFTGKSVREWEEYYTEKQPGAIQQATDRIMEYLGKLNQVLSKVDRDMVEKWVRDLVIVKTFIGFKVQQVILKKVADSLGLSPLRLATSEEESQGIDGWLGEIPVSIKPESYKTKSSLQEGIQARIIYYTKTKSGITIDFDEMQK